MIRNYRGFFFVSFALGLRLSIWSHLCDASIDSPTGSMGLESIPRIFESGDFPQDHSKSFEELAHQSSHDVNLGKRPMGMGGTEHQEDCVSASQRILSAFESGDFEPLARSGLTSKCLELAEYIFQQKTHATKLQHFDYMFMKHNDDTASKKNAATFRFGETRNLERLPIVVSRRKGSETAVVRLVRPSGSRQGKTVMVSSLGSRIRWLFVAMDFFHNMAFEAGLDKSILGINGNLHGDLMKWFENVLFYQTEDSLPTMGYAHIGDKLPENLENYFAIPQKHLSLFLTLEEGSYSMFFYTILSLMGYWYKHVAPNARLDVISKSNRNFDTEFWRLMREELKKHNNVPYEHGKRMVLWSRRKS